MKVLTGLTVVVGLAVAGWFGFKWHERESILTLVTHDFLDPDAAEFRYVKVSSSYGHTSACGEVNGVNTYGAYTGYKAFYVWEDSVNVLGEGLFNIKPEDGPNLIKAKCSMWQSYADKCADMGSLADMSAPQCRAEGFARKVLAEQGDADAKFRLGFAYANGLGVPKDYFIAVRWYRLAAEQGHAEAMLYLGIMYNYGRGVPNDYVKAYVWFNMASNQGEDVELAKGLLEQVMTREQIAEAQRLSAECLANNYQNC